ncbi:MAG: hypothetical protein U0637_00110 [Phycisphaerales bacterium]
MTDLRTETSLVNLVTSLEEMATFVALTREDGAQRINHRWWGVPPGSTCGGGEQDRDWNWEELCGEALSKDYWEAVGLATQDDRLQGAIIYNVSAKSVLSSGAGAVYVDNLATAPWNRKWVTDTPAYQGIGPELLCQAVHHSHLLGLKGRVTLTPLPRAVAFYIGKGFVDTGEMVDGLPLFELKPTAARLWLKEKGLVGNG